MKITAILFFLMLQCHTKITKASKILGVFPSFGYSQYILAESLMIGLAEKGHDVTVISAFDTKGINNFRNFKVPITSQHDEDPGSFYKNQGTSIFENIRKLKGLGIFLTEQIFMDEKVQGLLNSEEKFDVVIVETFLNEAQLVFAKHFNAHLILFSSIAVSEWNADIIGNPLIPSYLSLTYSGYTSFMTFYERFRNTMAVWYDRYYYHFYHIPAHQALIDKYMPKKYSLVEEMYNASIMLTCSHVSTAESIPLTTSIIEVGGLHIKMKGLPETLKMFLDSATDGVILFSMGSILQGEHMPTGTVREILEVIRRLKQKVIWKYEGDNLEAMPENLMILKWTPQSDILAHPNLVAFISHCGMGSSTEAIRFGVPVIGIPMFGDQHMNIKRLVQFGMAIELPFKQLSGKTLENSINEITTKNSYGENAQARSAIMTDRLTKPMDEAVYWVEYVIRHKGAHHFNNSIRKLPWYQLYLIDIISVLIVIPYLLFVITRFLIRRIR